MPKNTFLFTDEAACWNQLVALRWPGGVFCQRCHQRMGLRPRRRLFQCPRCARHVSVTAGTLFHRSRIPLRKWFEALYWMALVPGGISMLELQKQLELKSYRAAWLLAHKIRRVMLDRESVRLIADIPDEVRFIKRPFQEDGKPGSRVPHGWRPKYHHAYLAELAYRRRIRAAPQRAFRLLLQACIEAEHRPLKELKTKPSE